MESKTNAPSFTVSLRGYDRMEVDEYLDSLAEALGQVEQAEERVHGLQAHIDRQNARIADLEERIRSDVPRTGSLLGERIAILLRSAEEAAEEALTQARAEAAALKEQAQQEVGAADDRARGAIQRGEEEARRIETAARAEAAEIIAEAESRAATRTRQIEQWAEQVISHTRAEEARMAQEHLDMRRQGEAELQALIAQRDAVAANIAQLREQLGQALGLVVPAAPSDRSDDDPAPAAGAPDPRPEAAGPDPRPEAAVAGAETGTAGMATPAADASPAELEPEVKAESPIAEGGDSIGETVGRETGAGHGDQGPTDHAAGADDDDEIPWPTAFRPVDGGPDDHPGSGAPADVDRSGDDGSGHDASDDDRREDDDHPAGDPTGELQAPVMAGDTALGGEPDEFDTKFDAWMTSTDGPRHFRRL